MRIIEAKAEILLPQMWTESGIESIYDAIEDAARTCYKSEGKAERGEAGALVRKLIARGHEAMLEHASMTVRFTVDRGVSHELVRHRLASYAQESTRYCNYSRERFGGEITVVRPVFFQEGTESYRVWQESCEAAERAYFALLNVGELPERARDVLPMSVKTELIMSANMREWRHFFRLRAAGTTGKPHPQMRQVALPLLEECRSHMPELFGDI